MVKLKDHYLFLKDGGLFLKRLGVLLQTSGRFEKMSRRLFHSLDK
jgi:hypothetical protein